MSTTVSVHRGIPNYIAGIWSIDPVHSEVGFSVRHIMLSRVRGRFTRFSGQIVTGDDPLDSSVTANVEMTSVDTGNETRDNDLRSPDFFDVYRYPTMSFRSTGLRSEPDHYVLDGHLTLKAVTKPISMFLEVGGFGLDVEGRMRAGFTATGSLNRRDFGVDYDALLLTGGVVVADQIDIHLDIEAVLDS